MSKMKKEKTINQEKINMSAFDHNKLNTNLT